MASLSGASTQRSLAKDHAVLASSCGLKSEMILLAAEDIDYMSGASPNVSRANAQTEFAICRAFMPATLARRKSTI